MRTPAAPSAEVFETIATNKYGLSQATSSKVALRFRELCYETVEKNLGSLYQSAHKSLATEYLLRLTPVTTASLPKSELDARMAKFVKMLAVKIEATAFEASGTQTIYKTLLGHRVKEIKGFETNAKTGPSVLTSQHLELQLQQQNGYGNVNNKSAQILNSKGTKDSNLAWTTAIAVWQAMDSETDQ